MSAMNMQPPPVPAQPTRRAGPRLATSLIVMGAGIIIGIVAVVAIVLPLAGSFTSPAYGVPNELHLHLHDARYTVYQFTGTRSVFGGQSNSGALRIPPSALTVTAPDGSSVPVAYASRNERLTRGSDVYQSSLEFDAPAGGDYVLQFRNASPGQVIISRSIEDALRGVLAWFAVGALGGLLLVAGLVMLIVGITRRGRAKRAAYATWGPPPAQWGPPPQQQWGPGPQQQWGPPPQQPQQQWGPPPQQQWAPPGQQPPQQWTPPPGQPPPPPAEWPAPPSDEPPKP